MYTSTDTNEVLRLLEQYHVTYIFVGSKEKEKYGDALNESLLQSIGDLVTRYCVRYDIFRCRIHKRTKKQEKRTAGCGIFSPVFHIIQRMQKKVRRADHAEIPKSAARSSAASGCDNGGYSLFAELARCEREGAKETAAEAEKSVPCRAALTFDDSGRMRAMIRRRCLKF